MSAAISLSQIRDEDGPFSVGLGTLPGMNDVSMGLSRTGSLLLANVPQFICSLIFLGFNYILTSFCLGREWMSYSQYRKPLRVTEPTDGQRSSYFLHLPYRFSIPLFLVSGLISWLASQILFPVEVQVIGNTTPQFGPAPSIITCGYSPGTLVIATIFGVVLALAVFLLGLMRFPDTMPLAATNSAAISAACHPPPEDKNCAYRPIMWGVVSQDEEIGHCSFSAGPVEALIPGKTYR